MSWDIELISKPCCTCGEGGKSVYDGNFTTNYSTALHAAGAPWWPDIEGVEAGTIVEPLKVALDKLLAEPELYGAMILGGGQWGTIDTLTIAVRDFLNACVKHPDAMIQTSG